MLRFALLALFTVLTGAPLISGEGPAAPAKEIVHSADSLETVKEAVASGKALLLDVREQGEWDAAHVKGAQHIPLSEIKAGTSAALKSLPADKPVYVHCAVGGRALLCAKLLKDKGLDLRAVKFNTGDFEKAGLTLEKK
jgi:phage shock protein E